MEKVKEYVNENKKNIIIAVVLFVGVIVAYNVFSAGNVSTDRITSNTVREQLESVGDQQQRAGQTITTSQSITTEIQRSNNVIRSTNREIESTINNSQQLNKSSADCIKDSQRILREARASRKVEN
ncbi:hypothetical protein [Pelosinus sp. sgz500959]|uniref:hypothetical protein n=1 Tax=Pelosinus sp. sgz500959 TaxID=3242472 RepID=UPI00366E1FFF